MPQRTTTRPSIPALVKRAQLGFRAALDDALREHGLSASQYGVLKRLHEQPGLSNAELARLTYVSAQAMQELLAGLEAGGLVVRSDDPAHGRIRRATLSPAGEALATTCRGVADRVEARMLAGLDGAERAQLADLLRRCAESIEPVSR